MWVGTPAGEKIIIIIMIIIITIIMIIIHLLGLAPAGYLAAPDSGP
jgi:hypothetical protein